MSCERSLQRQEIESSTSDSLRLRAYERSSSMSRTEADLVLDRVKDGQKIDDLLTITAALWVTGDVDSASL
jgi:hypothetical protein